SWKRLRAYLQTAGIVPESADREPPRAETRRFIRDVLGIDDTESDAAGGRPGNGRGLDVVPSVPVLRNTLDECLAELNRVGTRTNSVPKPNYDANGCTCTEGWVTIDLEGVVGTFWGVHCDFDGGTGYGVPSGSGSSSPWVAVAG